MKNQKTFNVEIINDTFIGGEHVKAGKTVNNVSGEDAFVLVANNKARLVNDETAAKAKK